MLYLRVKRVLWDSSCAHCEALMARHSHRVQARTTCYTPAYARTAYCEAHKTATANKESQKAADTMSPRRHQINTNGWW